MSSTRAVAEMDTRHLGYFADHTSCKAQNGGNIARV
jgi:hypothetical protein